LSTTVIGSKFTAPHEPLADDISHAGTTKRRRTKGPSEKLRSLAALSLAPKLGYLQLSDLVGPDDRELQAFIDQQLRRKTFAAETEIYPGGATPPFLFIVKTGKVGLVRISASGGRFPIKVLETGDIFGEMPLFGQSMLGAHAEAIETCELIVIGEADTEQMLKDSPSLSLKLLHQIGPKLVESGIQHEQAAFQPVTARVASLLLGAADESNQVTGLTHQEMADTLGVYRETVTNALAELKQDGLIEIGRKRILLRDREALARLTSF
jgi:CRP/FNR family transcriptional regulator, cyclic AMP receptor protein